MKTAKQIATENLQASYNRSLLSLSGLDLSDPKQLEFAERSLSFLLLSVRQFSSYCKFSEYANKLYSSDNHS